MPFAGADIGDHHPAENHGETGAERHPGVVGRQCFAAHTRWKIVSDHGSCARGEAGFAYAHSHSRQKQLPVVAR